MARTRDSSTTTTGRIRGRLVSALLIVGLAGLLLWRPSSTGPSPMKGIAEEAEPLPPAVQAMLDSEELLLGLSLRLDELEIAVGNLRLPDASSRELFAPEVRVRDVAPKGEGEPGASVNADEGATLHSIGARPVAFTPAAAASSVLREELDLWAALFEGVDHFESAEMRFVRGEWLGSGRARWRGELAVHALAHRLDGTRRAIDVDQDVVWVARDGAGASQPESWEIESWETRSVHVLEVPEPLFEEVLGRVLVDDDALAEARRSHHEEAIVGVAKGEIDEPDDLFEVPAGGQHPSVSVVDVDADGFDDLFVTRRYSTNVLYRNQGDGTFRDESARWGLDFAATSTSSLFVDVDNDGDPDLVLGNFAEGSRLLIHEGDRFVERTGERVSGDMPYQVASVSAADFDGDGLIDVYLSTYRGRGFVKLEYLPEAYHELMPAEEYEEFLARVKAPDHHMVKNRAGPRNVLLRNVGGGGFEVASDVPELFAFRNTFQASWADYDDDGDPDLYLANDYAPNNLFRNDGAGRFEDVTDATGTADVGFGMGVTWGDYDQDGRQDLYVSNMYSKAGLRITGQLAELDLDRTFGRMAKGNTLFRNEGDRFAVVSGKPPGGLAVEKAGWSWAGQFVDVDNDTDLDLHVLSGYVTIPDEVAHPLDL